MVSGVVVVRCVAVVLEVGHEHEVVAKTEDIEYAIPKDPLLFIKIQKRISNTIAKEAAEANI